MRARRSIKICVLGLRGIPQVVGGIETHCENLLPGLKRLRPADEISVVARRHYVPSAPYMHGGVWVVPLPHAKASYLEAISNSFLGVLYAGLRLRADILHIHAIGPSLVTPLAKALRMKVVVTHHGTDYDRAKWNWVARSALRLGEAFAVLLSDRLIVVSPSLAAHLKRKFPRRAERIRFIPNGANHLASLKPDPERRRSVLRRFGLSGEPFVLSVGRLVPEKAFHELIEAFENSGVNAKLVIAGGPGIDRSYAERLCASAGDRVVFTGAVNRADLMVLLQETSLFVLPSHHEGLPIAALEAAMAGAPLLLSDIPANLDLGLPTAHYFHKGDVTELARRLAEPHQNFALRDRDVLAPYNWDYVCRETDEVYAAVAP
jgi:glycosyltransferase involved in cell wall biosynthesis